MKEKKFVECFGLFGTTLLYVNMKHKKTLYADFVNVNIALNLHSYEKS